jgi:hypothetical protein
MKSQDQTLLEQAYLSTQQKMLSIPGDGVSEPSPETTPDVSPVTPTVSPVAVQMSMNTEEEKEELSMVKANLFSIFNDAKALHTMIQSGLDAEPWMQQKLAVCADSMSSVLKSANYDFQKNSSCGCSEAY